MAVTLTDVAKQAKVSIATVSAVVNKKTDRYKISADTIDRVQKVVDQLHYRPSPSARALHRGRSETVGVLLFRQATIANEIYGTWAAALTTRFHERNINTMLLIDESGVEIPKMIRERHVDGVILVEIIPKHIYHELMNLKIPMVIVNAYPVQPVDSVRPNDRQGMRDAIKHLMDLGHRRISYFGLPRVRPGTYDHPSSHDRREAFVDTLLAAGLPAPQHPMESPGDSRDDLAGWIKYLLTLPEPQRPTAIISYSDRCASLIPVVARQMGLSLPEDLSVVTFNNTFMTMTTDPPMTTVDIKVTEMGRAAADMLYAKVYEDAGEVPAVIVSEEVIIRQSSAPPKKP